MSQVQDILRVDQIQARLQSILSRSKISSLNFTVVVYRIRFFPTLISKIKWLGYGLPLIEIILGTSREIDRN